MFAWELAWDKGKTGKVKYASLRWECKRYKPGMTEDDIDALLARLGANCDPAPYVPFLQWLCGVTDKIFMCCQQTQSSQSKLANLVTPTGREVRVSACRFNMQLGLPEGVVGIDVPCFGAIPSCVVEMFLRNPALQNSVEKLGFAVPKYKLNVFAQKKMKKVRIMCQEARKLHLNEHNVAAIAKIETFSKKFEELSAETVPTLALWNKWMRSFVPEGYMEKLDFEVMLSNFGVDDAVAKEIRKLPYSETDAKTGKMETVTLEQYGLRWLGKAMAGFNPDGCLTDVVNAVVAMLYKDNKSIGHMSEKEVLQALSEFENKVRRNKLDDLWIPTHLIHDAESDDMLVWGLLEHLHESQNTKLQVTVQLPDTALLDQVVESWLRKGLVEESAVFKDPSSANIDALLHNFGVVGCR